MRNRLAAVGVAVVASVVLAACGSGNSSPESGGEPSGTITVLTQRTDIVDSVFTRSYLPKFKQKYPKVNVVTDLMILPRICHLSSQSRPVDGEPT